MWRAEILTLYPEFFPGLLGGAIMGKALEKGLWDLRVVGMRDFGLGEHRRVDDSPCGGGGGMVLRADVVSDSVLSLGGSGFQRIYLSARGRRLNQGDIERWSGGDGLTLLCGRFEGVDQRVIDEYGFDEVCLGDFVLNGGEVAAMAIIESCVRLLPDVIGNELSLCDESFSDGLLQYPQYTLPVDWCGYRVPDILLSGDHGAISAWRREQSLESTRLRRADLWDAWLGKVGDE